MNAPKDPEVRTEPRPRSFTGVAVDFAAATAIITPFPLVHTGADGRMGRMAPPIALPLVGIEQCAAPGDVFRGQGCTGAGISTVAPPEAVFARLPRHHADDGGTVVGLGPVPLALIRTATGWIGRVAMRGAFSPSVSLRCIRFKRRAGHPPSRRGLVQVGWHPLA